MRVKTRIFTLLLVPMILAGIGLIHLTFLLFPSSKISSNAQLIIGVVLGLLFWIVDSIVIYRVISRAQYGKIDNTPER